MIFSTYNLSSVQGRRRNWVQWNPNYLYYHDVGVRIAQISVNVSRRAQVEYAPRSWCSIWCRPRIRQDKFTVLTNYAHPQKSNTTIRYDLPTKMAHQLDLLSSSSCDARNIYTDKQNKRIKSKHYRAPNKWLYSPRSKPTELGLACLKRRDNNKSFQTIKHIQTHTKTQTYHTTQAKEDLVLKLVAVFIWADNTLGDLHYDSLPDTISQTYLASHIESRR